MYKVLYSSPISKQIGKLYKRGGKKGRIRGKRKKKRKKGGEKSIRRKGGEKRRKVEKIEVWWAKKKEIGRLSKPMEQYTPLNFLLFFS